jgi:hypothetical protein
MTFDLSPGSDFRYMLSVIVGLAMFAYVLWRQRR